MKRFIPCLLAPSVCYASSAPILCKHKPKVPSPLRHVVSLNSLHPAVIGPPNRSNPMSRAPLRYTWVQLEDILAPGELTPGGEFLMEVFGPGPAKDPNDPASPEKVNPK